MKKGYLFVIIGWICIALSEIGTLPKEGFLVGAAFCLLAFISVSTEFNKGAKT
jgi:uncharacterized membrane protein YbaN (DUF454 family)